jgi:hypothetical protein
MVTFSSSGKKWARPSIPYGINLNPYHQYNSNFLQEWQGKNTKQKGASKGGKPRRHEEPLSLFEPAEIKEKIFMILIAGNSSAMY